MLVEDNVRFQFRNKWYLEQFFTEKKYHLQRGQGQLCCCDDHHPQKAETKAKT